MSDKSKLEQLEDAGILERRHFSAEELKLVDSITEEEIQILVKLRKKMGAAGEGKHHIRPNIIV